MTALDDEVVIVVSSINTIGGHLIMGIKKKKWALKKGIFSAGSLDALQLSTKDTWWRGTPLTL